jgi:formamidopyrimidine-DNA glycosylase
LAKCLFDILELTPFSDEILYHAKIHPEQYSNTLNDDQIKELHSSIHYVCSTSIGVLADSEKFPEHWLFKHRWGKGKKNQPAVLPNGDKITFLTVGGRTSAVVAAVQKKTGAVAKEVDEDATNGMPAISGRKRAVPKTEEDSETEEVPKAKKRGSPKQKQAIVKNEELEEEKAKPATTGRKRSTRAK